MALIIRLVYTTKPVATSPVSNALQPLRPDRLVPFVPCPRARARHMHLNTQLPRARSDPVQLHSLEVKHVPVRPARATRRARARLYHDAHERRVGAHSGGRPACETEPEAAPEGVPRRPNRGGELFDELAEEAVRGDAEMRDARGVCDPGREERGRPVWGDDVQVCQGGEHRQGFGVGCGEFAWAGVEREGELPEGGEGAFEKGVDGLVSVLADDERLQVFGDKAEQLLQRGRWCDDE